MKIILSICIATYNRAKFIGPTLESIVSQVEEGVEILVVDGASPDNTEEVVRKYQQKCPRLRYVRLPVKGGVDQDYDRSVELARGDYCWLFTDDDLLKPGAVLAVLDAVKQGYSLVIANAEIRNMDLSRLLVERKLSLMEDSVYEDIPADKERFLAEVGDYLTFIGGVVINRELWLSRVRAKYYGSRFIHVGVIFQSPLPGRILALATPQIVIRLGNAEWSRLSFEIWMFKWPDLIWSFVDFSNESKRVVCRPNPWRRLHTFVYYRALEVYSLDEYDKFLAQRLNSGWKRLVARLIAVMPVRLAYALMLLYTVIRRNQLLKYHLQNSNFSSQQQTKNDNK